MTNVLVVEGDTTARTALTAVMSLTKPFNPRELVAKIRSIAPRAAA